MLTIEIFQEFPYNLIKEITRKISTKVLLRNEIVRYKLDDMYYLMLSGSIIKMNK